MGEAVVIFLAINVLPYLIGGIIAGIYSSKGKHVKGLQKPLHDANADITGKEYEAKYTDIPPVQSKPLADQLDTRFTNIVKNPWEDIL